MTETPFSPNRTIHIQLDLNFLDQYPDYCPLFTMPAARRKSGPQAVSSARSAPYTKSPPNKQGKEAGNEDKENSDPQSAQPADQASDKPSNYLDIKLEEIKGEVPCYEDVSKIPKLSNARRANVALFSIGFLRFCPSTTYASLR